MPWTNSQISLYVHKRARNRESGWAELEAYDKGSNEFVTFVVSFGHICHGFTTDCLTSDGILTRAVRQDRLGVLGRDFVLRRGHDVA